jgi:hypothetical protein
LKQILYKRLTANINLLDFGATSYALDEIIQRMLEILQNKSRSIEKSIKNQFEYSNFVQQQQQISKSELLLQ